MTQRRLRVLVVALAVSTAAAWPLARQADRPDLDALYRIKDEGLQRSKVMAITSYLTDVYGPRLTNSPNFSAAADYVQQQLTAWGLVNVHRETFPFGQGWANQRFVALAVSPQAWPIIAAPKAWTPGTTGVLRAEVVVAPILTEQDFDRFKGQLRGRIVFTAPARDVPLPLAPLASRDTGEDLAALAMQPDPGPPGISLRMLNPSRFAG